MQSEEQYTIKLRIFCTCRTAGIFWSWYSIS